jgi:hypothetical protein
MIPNIECQSYQFGSFNLLLKAFYFEYINPRLLESISVEPPDAPVLAGGNSLLSSIRASQQSGQRPANSADSDIPNSPTETLQYCKKYY